MLRFKDVAKRDLMALDIDTERTWSRQDDAPRLPLLLHFSLHTVLLESAFWDWLLLSGSSPLHWQMMEGCLRN